MKNEFESIRTPSSPAQKERPNLGRKLIQSVKRTIGRKARAMRWPPIFIFQMGKVGSETLYWSLRRQYHGRIVYGHRLSKLTPDEKRLLVRRKRFRLPILVICPVRDPISRNISSFFQNFTRDTGLSWGDRSWTNDDLLSLFLNKHNHDSCLTWFNTRFKPAFGLDLLAVPFPAERKWCIYSKGGIRVLVYRTDLPVPEQIDLIEGFTGVGLNAYRNCNRGEDKAYQGIYRGFLDAVKLPPDYINKMLTSDYTRHFWSEEEIRLLSESWSRRSGCRDVTETETEI